MSEPVARRLWPGESPIGRRLRVLEGAADDRWLTVVGVSAPTRHMHLLSAPSPVVYVPYTNDVSPLVSSRSIVVAARVVPGRRCRCAT